jgi:hypothetical protein
MDLFRHFDESILDCHHGVSAGIMGSIHERILLFCYVTSFCLVSRTLVTKVGHHLMAITLGVRLKVQRLAGSIVSHV